MSEYVFRDAPYFGCDMNELMDEVRGNMTLGEYYASHNDDHYGTLHEEIVRCRDCAKFVALSIAGYAFCGCTRFESDGEDMQSTDPNGFCAWGERKVEE